MKNNLILCLLLSLMLIYSNGYANRNIPVNSLEQLKTAISNAVAGDRIVLVDGIYHTDAIISISAKGTAIYPIVIEAQTVGGVTLSGEGGFTLTGNSAYVVIKGFVFTHKGGTTGIDSTVKHCTFTQNIFECTGKPEETLEYLKLDGDSNVVSYNTFRNKTTIGPMVSIQGPGEKMSKGNWIHHNYFLNFPKNENNTSALQPGYRVRKMDSAFLLIEHNLFEKINSEAEGIMSVKCCDVTFRHNTIGPGCMQVSLRQGNRNEISGNYFLAGGHGLRFCGDDHKVYNNVFTDCDESITIWADGAFEDDAPSNAQDKADRCFIGYNTLINCKSGYVVRKDKSGYGAESTSFVNNILVRSGEVSASNNKNPIWSCNLLWNTSPGSIPPSGYKIADPLLEDDSSGIPHLGKNSPAIGKGTGVYPFVSIDVDGQERGSTADTGADQYHTTLVINRPLTVADVGPNAPGN